MTPDSALGMKLLPDMVISAEHPVHWTAADSTLQQLLPCSI